MKSGQSSGKKRQKPRKKRPQPGRKGGEIKMIVFGIKTEREIDWKLGVENKAYAYAMLGFGAVTSYIFIVGCLIKYIGV